jgi:hypothetical protein
VAPNLHYPYEFDGRGHTSTDAYAAWIRGLVFAPNSDELAATTQVLAQGALQQWLGELITLESLQVQAVDATLTVTVRYLIRLTGERAEHTLVRGGVA